MSSTYAEALRAALLAGDNSLVVSLLEARIKQGLASESERLLCGVVLLMPPLADYEGAAALFSGLLGSSRGFEAAVWDAYRFAVLLPDGDRTFENVLRSHDQSAIAAHMLGLLASADGDTAQALTCNRRSRALRPFPFNLVQALRLDFALPSAEKAVFWHLISDLVVSTTAESDAQAGTVEGALQRRWDNLIVGTRITSPLWDEYRAIFRKV
ncbi:MULTISPECIES: hypothetical protein [unclassified Lysobacter]|uniref:hypothetical protein n=1 Tax=unclassified Lysobacter TaxID=2635362 RepID=UPI001BE84FFA|nr:MULTISPECIES: hypothetical protein [unclassified Lysobacter]MBT2745118.1 hypothetical protein [Lysobacter sp. ISL-42]MBT2750955.1 hypothetical protein [Lysobacter sp. ISL-50]MBT2778022.1 hypothetical protein [Lysobacter sp. ISL-54]MBT2783920.1 hypothetical protein [Lysobacter sp. ISL-52]